MEWNATQPIRKDGIPDDGLRMLQTTLLVLKVVRQDHLRFCQMPQLGTRQQ